MKNYNRKEIEVQRKNLKNLKGKIHVMITRKLIRSILKLE